MKSHLNIKPFQCHLCSNAFVRYLEFTKAGRAKETFAEVQVNTGEPELNNKLYNVVS
jgi:hypothetical protein